MAVAIPPVEEGSILELGSSGQGGMHLALTLTMAVPIGALVYVVAGVDHNGAAPLPWTDTRGNVFAACGSASPSGATQVFTFASVLTAALQIGDTIAPGFVDGHAVLVGASAVTSGLAGPLQTVSAIGGGNGNPSVTTATFPQDNTLVFLVVCEQGGQSDNGYVDDDNITPDAVDYPQGDRVTWGWVIPFGREPMNFNPTFGGPTHWGLVADTMGAIEANLERRIAVDPVAGAIPAPFIPDDPRLPHRLRMQGKQLLDGRTGERWIGMGYNHSINGCLVPGMSSQDNPLGLDDMALTKAAGAVLARIELMWQDNSNLPSQFTGYITPDNTLTVLTAPTNPIAGGNGGAAVPVIDQAGAIAAGTQITGPISVAQDGTGTYHLRGVAQTVGSPSSPDAMTASPLYPPENSSDSYNPVPYTDPNTGRAALVDPTHLALLDLRIAAAAAQGLWIVLQISGGNEGFWTDGVSIANFCDLWRFLVARYAHYDKIAMWELLVEPHPTQDPTNNTILAAMYAQVITAIREIDTRTPILVGPAKTYNICNVQQIYQALALLGVVDNIAVTFNWYNLGDYVKSSGRNPNNPELWQGYPSNPDDPNDPVYPWVLDHKGDSRNAGGIYPGKGQLVCLNADWMRGMFSVAVNFREQFGVPVWCDALGIATNSIGGLQWMTDVLTMMTDYDVGGAVSVWRNGRDTTPNNGGGGMVGRLTLNGPWIPKYGTGAPGDTWGNWIGTIQGFLR